MRSCWSTTEIVNRRCSTNVFILAPCDLFFRPKEQDNIQELNEAEFELCNGGLATLLLSGLTNK